MTATETMRAFSRTFSKRYAASLIETCKLNSVNPNAWLTDVLTKLVNRWPARRIDELMPWPYADPPVTAYGLLAPCGLSKSL